MGEMMGGMMGQMTTGMNAGMMGGAIPWFGLATLGVILVLGLALAFAVMRRPTVDDPREIVRRRFARGELSPEEFAEAQRTLG
jgi:uncharacterized membrane protein